jgi:hypothetical protein
MTRDNAGDGRSPQRARRSYDVTAEFFIGSLVAIIGALVLVTPLFSAMPRNHPMNPALLDVIVGGMYVVIGGVVFARARRKATRARQPERSVTSTQPGEGSENA